MGRGTDESHSGEEHTREWARAVAAGAGARGGGLRLLRLSGAGKVGEFVANKETGVLADPTLREVLLSSFTALAGATMVLAYRRSVIAGPLVALAIVPAAMVGVALAAGRPMLAYQGAECFVLYVALIVAWGAGRSAQAGVRAPPEADGVVSRGVRPSAPVASRVVEAIVSRSGAPSHQSPRRLRRYAGLFCRRGDWYV